MTSIDRIFDRIQEWFTQQKDIILDPEATEASRERAAFTLGILARVLRVIQEESGID